MSIMLDSRRKFFGRAASSLAITPAVLCPERNAPAPRLQDLARAFLAADAAATGGDDPPPAEAYPAWVAARRALIEAIVGAGAAGPGSGRLAYLAGRVFVVADYDPGLPPELDELVVFGPEAQVVRDPEPMPRPPRRRRARPAERTRPDAEALSRLLERFGHLGD